jgi:hypothetical protein
MADTKISALTAVSTLTGASELAVNEAATSKKATVTQVVNNLHVVGQSAVFHLGSDHALASTTGTEVTDIGPVTLAAGTYNFKYWLVISSGTATTGLGLGINFTGTHTRLVFMRFEVATITTASNGLVEEESGAALTTGGVMNAWASKAESTTAPTTVSAGVGATSVDCMAIIEGIIVVTASGDLELWHSSETAATTTVESGSNLVVTRVA